MDMTSRPAAIKLPRLPAAARRAGATTIQRCNSGNTFAVGFALVGTDISAPGNGEAVVAALRAWAKGDFEVSWTGRQADAICIKAL